MDEPVESPEPVDPRALLADWRSAPRTLGDRLLIAKGCRIRMREICQITGLDRATVRSVLRQMP